MTDWYWDAATTQQQALYADRDGTLAKPWVLGPGRFGINPGAMDVSVFGIGDTLWIRGQHVWTGFDTHFNVAGLNGLTIRGNYSGNPGKITGMALSTATNVAVYDLEMVGLTLTSGTGITIDTCHIHDGSKGIIADPDEDLDDITIQNCEIHDFTHQGMELFCTPGSSRDNWLIAENHVYNVARNQTNPDVDGEGIGIQRLSNSVIRDNHIHHCDYGINLFESGTGVVTDLVISGNYVHDIGTGPVTWPSRGIMMSGGSTTAGSVLNITISGNLVHTVGKEGIRLQAPASATGLVVTDNAVAAVNTEFGTPNTEYVVAPAPWSSSNNRTYPVFRRYNRHNNSFNTRSWKL